MKIFDFLQMQEDFPLNGKIDDVFLTKELAKQKLEKGKDDTITYYKIINVSKNGNIEYVMNFDTLEEV